jgi:DNA-binding NtrC family response regulator
MQNKTPHVIVCDDDAELNSFMRNHFKLDGYETHQALSAQECIDKLAELGDTIDAITVDGKIASDRSVMLILNVKRVKQLCEGLCFGRQRYIRGQDKDDGL